MTLKSPELIVPNVFAVNVGDTIRFRVKQEGPAPHNLHISDNGVEVESPRWPSGTSDVWEVTFTRPGVHSLYCSVLGRIPGVSPAHRDVGPMEGVIVVTEPGVTADLARYQTRNLALASDGGSGVTGTAHLQQRADGVIAMRVEGSGLTIGNSYFIGVHDRTGAVIGSFSAPVPASAATLRLLHTIPGPIENVASVMIHQGTTPPGIVPASGDIAKAVLGAGAVLPAAPAALPRTGEGFPQAGPIAALVGALLLAAGMGLRRART